MGMEITPLGFRKPDGRQLVKTGDNDIAHNAKVADARFMEDRAILSNLLNAAEFPGDPLELNDAAVANAAASGDLTRPLINAAIASRSRTFTLTSDMYPELDDTGVAPASAAILAILDSLPSGATAKMPGKYNMDTTIWPDITDRSLHIDNTGGMFILKNTGTAIIFEAAWESQIGIAALDLASITMDGNIDTQVSRLTTSSAFGAGWVRGDLVKVISDDVLPAGHVTSEINKPRVGEFATVYEVVGNQVYLSGPLLEGRYMTTNIRAARVPKSSVTFTNPTARVENSSVTSRQTVNFLRFQNLVYPKVVGFSVEQLTGMGLSFKSCFGYRVDSGITHYNTDDTANGVVGYSVHDSSCNFGEIIGGVFMGGRHAFTDGAGDIPEGSADTSSYGAQIGLKVSHAKAIFMKHAGFDTHHNSLNTEFDHCIVHAVPGAPAFLLRGRGHHVNSPIVVGGREVLYVGTQVSGAWGQGESYGHKLTNFTATGTERILTDARRANVGHPFYNVRDTRPTIINGGTIAGNKRNFVLVNSAVRLMGDINSELGPVLDAGNVTNLANSELYGTSHLRVDATGVTTLGVNNWLINCDDGAASRSIVRLERMSIKASPEYAAGMPTGPITINSNTAEFTIRDLLFENYPWATSTPIDATDTNLGVQNISYRVLSDSAAGSQPATRSSAFLGKSNGSIATTMRNLFRSIDPVLTLALTVSDSTARTLIVLPPGKFPGQRLTIFVAAINGGAVITVKTGVTGNIDLTGGTDKTLTAAGQSITAVFGGSRWVQIG